MDWDDSALGHVWDGPNGTSAWKVDVQGLRPGAIYKICIDADGPGPLAVGYVADVDPSSATHFILAVLKAGECARQFLLRGLSNSV